MRHLCGAAHGVGGVVVTRLFMRLPAFDTAEEAVDHCEAIGGGVPKLHPCQSAAFVGAVEITDVNRAMDVLAEYAGDLLKRAEALR